MQLKTKENLRNELKTKQIGIMKSERKSKENELEGLI